MINNLLRNIQVIHIIGNTQINIQSLCLNSKEVQANAMFFAIKGTAFDGHKFIETAIKNGAAAIVCETLPEQINKNVTYIQVHNTQSVVGLVANNFYHQPSKKLQVIGITGTNGKTTTATLLYKLFTELGHKTALISTIEIKINQQTLETTHTTPDAISLQKLLSQMLNNQCEYVFMEVSSHAVSQHRINGIHFTAGVFSNLTHDHLDYHGNFENYLKAKKMFFDQLPPTAVAISNIDDKNGAVMLQNTKAKKITYALKTMANFKARIIENNFNGLLLNIDEQETYFRLAGEFNAYNLLATYTTAKCLGKQTTEILTVLSNLTSAEGRFDCIYSQHPNPKDTITAIVDYAHTPDALEKILTTINNTKKSLQQVITVVGCGGDRDAAKRPKMAKIACLLSNKVILTSDNPRTENAYTILEQMQKGIPANYENTTITIENRKEAIKIACQLAQNGDIILIAGKGHEKYQEINDIKYPFDDKEIVKKYIKNE